MTTSERVEARYFHQLSQLVGVSGQDLLLRQLHDTPFIWVISNDVNRAEDGLELRDSILQDMRVAMRVRDQLSGPDASVLEVLAALAERASHQTETSMMRWFWIFMENLGLADLDLDDDHEAVDRILQRWMTRDYPSNGEGGLFPIQRTAGDQREMEIWDQMSTYIMEELEAAGFFD